MSRHPLYTTGGESEDDHELIRRVLNGDELAGSMLVSLYCAGQATRELSQGTYRMPIGRLSVNGPSRRLSGSGP